MHEWSVADIGDLTGRIVLITGANSGLGLASAEALAANGARVLMACRNPAKGDAARAQVAAVATGTPPELVTLDLADLHSVTSCADEVAARVDHLDILMNNAGVMALPQGRTADGFEVQFGTNHLGHFALTGQLLPLLLAAESPRVVTTSSGVHKAGTIHWDDLNLEVHYGKWQAYAQSKLANLLFAFELDRQTATERVGLLSVAGHPGYASTHLQAAGPEMTGNHLMVRATDFGNSLVAQSASDGALPQLRAATDPTARGGDYYGPSRLGELRGTPKLVKAKKAAYDPFAAGRAVDRVRGSHRGRLPLALNGESLMSHGEDDESVGSNVGRVLAFSDGVFAIAATLLVLNLKLPRNLHGPALHHAVSVLEGNLESAVITFAVIGLFWLGHHRLWTGIDRVDQRLLVLNLAFLGLMVVLPFAAQVLGDYGDHEGAVIAYALLISVASLLLLAEGHHVRSAGLAIGRPRRMQPLDWIRSVVIGGVFLVSVPVALVSPSWATRAWILAPLLLTPAVRLMRRRSTPADVITDELG